MIRRNPDVAALVVLLAVVWFGQAAHRVIRPPVARLGVHAIGDSFREAGIELRALRNCR
jgi:hypothetical protein